MSGGEGSLGVPAQTAAPVTQPRITRKKMDGWMQNMSKMNHLLRSVYPVLRSLLGQTSSLDHGQSLKTQICIINERKYDIREEFR